MTGYTPYPGPPRRRRWWWWRMPLLILAGSVIGVTGGRAAAELPPYVGVPLMLAAVVAAVVWMVKG